MADGTEHPLLGSTRSTWQLLVARPLLAQPACRGFRACHPTCFATKKREVLHVGHAGPLSLSLGLCTFFCTFCSLGVETEDGIAPFSRQ